MMNINLYDLNTIAFDQLSSIPGIDEAFSTAIFKYRKSHDGFSHIDELWKINGITRSKYKILQRHVEVKDQQPLSVGDKLPYARESYDDVNAMVYSRFQKRCTELQRRVKSANGVVKNTKLITATPKTQRPASQTTHRKQRNTTNVGACKETIVADTTKLAFVSPAEPGTSNGKSSVARKQVNAQASKQRPPYTVQSSPSGKVLTFTCNVDNKPIKNNDSSWVVFQVGTGRGPRRSNIQIAPFKDSPLKESSTKVSKSTSRNLNMSQPKVHVLHDPVQNKASVSSTCVRIRESKDQLPTTPGAHVIELQADEQNNLPAICNQNEDASLFSGDVITQEKLARRSQTDTERERLIVGTRERLLSAKDGLKQIRQSTLPQPLCEGNLHDFEVRTYRTFGDKVRSIESWIDDVERETRMIQRTHCLQSQIRSLPHHQEDTNRLDVDQLVNDSSDSNNTIMETAQPCLTDDLRPSKIDEQLGENPPDREMRREDLDVTEDSQQPGYTKSNGKNAVKQTDDNTPIHKRGPQASVNGEISLGEGTSPKSPKTEKDASKEHNRHHESNAHNHLSRRHKYPCHHRRHHHRHVRHHRGHQSKKVEGCELM